MIAQHADDSEVNMSDVNHDAMLISRLAQHVGYCQETAALEFDTLYVSNSIYICLAVITLCCV